jgi:hypothetical protein
MKAAALILSGTLFVLNASVLFCLAAIRKLGADPDVLVLLAFVSLVLGIGVFAAGLSQKPERVE